MKTIYKKRLLKLAEHLERGKLEHKKFDFAAINVDKDDNILVVNGCGFAGCAIGECPAAFPRQWHWSAGGAMLRARSGSSLRGANTEIGFASAEQFFGLNDLESAHLFAPQCQITSSYGGRELGGGASAKSVAKNIRAFIKRKESAQCPT